MRMYKKIHMLHMSLDHSARFAHQPNALLCDIGTSRIGDIRSHFPLVQLNDPLLEKPLREPIATDPADWNQDQEQEQWH